ncbi:MAG TPA: hypothetical protein VMM78_10345, partial [Thermomicrobiales bacterium]|nr:hypothetical protein [Thermomicrobiales bacterium]
LAAALQRADMQVEQIVHSTGTAGLVYSIMGDLTGVSLKLRSRPLNESVYARTARVLGVAASPLCRAAAAIRRGGALEAYAVKGHSDWRHGAEPPR